MARFPHVTGLNDCTHVRIQRPIEHEYAYVNRKSFHSCIGQCVCDNTGRFTNVNAKWPGSTKILKESVLELLQV